MDKLDAIARFKADTNEAIVRVCTEAGWPAPTPWQLMKTMPA